jgi:hypothetical protein
MIGGGETLGDGAYVRSLCIYTHIQISVLMAASMIIKRYLRAAGFALAGCGWLIIGPCIPKHTP